MQENYYERLGELVLGSRLRKISERLLLEISGVYKAQNIDFEPGWFHTLFLLSENGEMSITELSDTLQVSHPSVIQVVKVMENRHIIQTFTGKEDRRKRVLKLTKDGQLLLEQIRPMWKKIQSTLSEMLLQGEHSQHLLLALKELEDNLKGESIIERMQK